MSWTKEEWAEFCRRAGVDPEKVLAAGSLTLPYAPHLKNKKGQFSTKWKITREKNLALAKLPHPKQQPRPPVALEPAPRGEDPNPVCSHHRTKLVITSHRTHMLDPDNLAGGSKYLIDGLRGCGLIEEDSWEKLELEIRQKKVSDLEAEKTVLEIEAP